MISDQESEIWECENPLRWQGSRVGASPLASDLLPAPRREALQRRQVDSQGLQTLVERRGRRSLAFQGFEEGMGLRDEQLVALHGRDRLIMPVAPGRRHPPPSVSV